MIEIEEGLSLFRKEITKSVSVIRLPIWECHNKILMEDIVAAMNVPPYPKSAMDGYAVRAEDVKGASKETPVRLLVIGELFAGDYQKIQYAQKTAVRVMTGSFIPDGFTAVVKQESTDYGEETVAVYEEVKPYQNYCRIGEDILEGTTVLKKGTCLTSIHIGLLASLGVAEVLVAAPLKISILSTGSELQEVGTLLMPGKIYNSISYMLKSEIEAEGYEVVRTAICPDEKETLKESIKQAVRESDIVITTGGVSVGKKDLLPEVMTELGAKILFHGVNIQPGTPTMAGIYEEVPVLSLSGNPYAALVNFEVFFWSIARMLQDEEWNAEENSEMVQTAILTSEYKKTSARRRFVRAYAKDGQVAVEVSSHASSVISNLLNCNCFIDIPANQKVNPGDKVTIRYIRRNSCIKKQCYTKTR